MVKLPIDRKSHVYIAGPMTGYENYNFAAFNAAAEKLRKEGFIVHNPADHGIVEGADWSDYLRYDVAELVKCEYIYLLPGWTKSKGALLEYELAEKLGILVLHNFHAEKLEITND